MKKEKKTESRDDRRNGYHGNINRSDSSRGIGSKKYQGRGHNKDRQTDSIREVSDQIMDSLVESRFGKLNRFINNPKYQGVIIQMMKERLDMVLNRLIKTVEDGYTPPDSGSEYIYQSWKNYLLMRDHSDTDLIILMMMNELYVDDFIEVTDEDISMGFTEQLLDRLTFSLIPKYFGDVDSRKVG